jgi:hypothetical protein
MEPKVVDLPSGAKARIHLASFATSKALYQSLLEELKTLKLDPDAEVDVNLFKDIFCAGLSSQKIEKCINECFKQVTYDVGAGFMKIDKDSFESVAGREDYFSLCFEVTKENIAPFTKSLYAQYAQIQGLMIGKSPA